MSRRRQADGLTRALAALLLLAGCQPSSGAEGAPDVRASPVARPRPSSSAARASSSCERASSWGARDPRFGSLSGLWLALGRRASDRSERPGRSVARRAGARRRRHAPRHRGWRAIEPATVPGDPTNGKRDAEALAGIGDDLVIAYEGRHRLRRVPRSAPEAAATAVPTPPELAEPHNRGIEALVGLEDGALLAIAEGVRRPSGDLAAWLIQDDRIAALGLCAGGRLRADRRRPAGRYGLRPGAPPVARAGCGARGRPGCRRDRAGARLVGASWASSGRPRSATTSRASRRAAVPTAGAALSRGRRQLRALLRTVLLQFAVRQDASARAEAPRRPGP